METKGRRGGSRDEDEDERIHRVVRCAAVILEINRLSESRIAESVN